MTDGLAHYGFDLDLRFGQEREGVLGNIFAGNLVEVKSDRQCWRTGNLFVEFRCGGKPSGLAVTLADYWAFEYRADRWLIVRTGELKRLCRVALEQGRVARGGDYDRCEGVLLPVSWLVEVLDR